MHYRCSGERSAGAMRRRASSALPANRQSCRKAINSSRSGMTLQRESEPRAGDHLLARALYRANSSNVPKDTVSIEHRAAATLKSTAVEVREGGVQKSAISLWAMPLKQGRLERHGLNGRRAIFCEVPWFAEFLLHASTLFFEILFDPRCKSCGTLSRSMTAVAVLVSTLEFFTRNRHVRPAGQQWLNIPMRRGSGDLFHRPYRI
jgi:hypothetical protein